MTDDRKFNGAVPTYLRTEGFSALIQSILEQSILPKEILIINYCEIDKDQLKRLREDCGLQSIKWVFHNKRKVKEPKGIAVSRNLALKLAETNNIP